MDKADDFLAGRNNEHPGLPVNAFLSWSHELVTPVQDQLASSTENVWWRNVVPHSIQKINLCYQIKTF